MSRTHSRKGSSRAPRLSSLLQQEIAAYMRVEMDLPGIVSISQIEAAPNMQSATVWLSIYGADEEEILKTMKSETRSLRKYLTDRLRAKYIPQLRFKSDPSEAHAQKISEALRDLDS